MRIGKTDKNRKVTPSSLGEKLSGCFEIESILPSEDNFQSFLLYKYTTEGRKENIRLSQLHSGESQKCKTQMLYLN